MLRYIRREHFSRWQCARAREVFNGTECTIKIDLVMVGVEMVSFQVLSFERVWTWKVQVRCALLAKAGQLCAVCVRMKPLARSILFSLSFSCTSFCLSYIHSSVYWTNYYWARWETRLKRQASSASASTIPKPSPFNLVSVSSHRFNWL